MLLVAASSSESLLPGHGGDSRSVSAQLQDASTSDFAALIEPSAGCERAVLSIAGSANAKVQSMCATSAAFAAITGR